MSTTVTQPWYRGGAFAGAWARRHGAPAEGFDWRLVLIAFVVIAAIAVGKTIVQSSTHPLLADTDDAMRMVTVRDLLAGQDWYDHLQHRLNAPFGAEIHWSHLVDAAIGGLVLLCGPLAGRMAETLAACAWPLLLLLGLLVLSAGWPSGWPAAPPSCRRSCCRPSRRP